MDHKSRITYLLTGYWKKNIISLHFQIEELSLKVTRRKGDTKGQWAEKENIQTSSTTTSAPTLPSPAPKEPPAPAPATEAPILMKQFDATNATPQQLDDVLRRPAQKTHDIISIIVPIIDDIRTNGDSVIRPGDYPNFPVLRSPFPAELMRFHSGTISAINLSFENIRKFHAGMKCTRFMHPIERVGLYIPGGTAALPSTALMLGIPALVAGYGSITPEVVFVAHKVGAECIVLAGRTQAVAALAYGTESVPKVDKILGPGNQFVTAGKMYVSNDTRAQVTIDMPAGPSEALVIADSSASPAFVASDLLSQAEYRVNSQLILIAVVMTEDKLVAIEQELHTQALVLPRVNIHLILHLVDPTAVILHITNAGSVFVGKWTPESVGDYSAGVNHSLPMYEYVRQYSEVNLGTERALGGGAQECGGGRLCSMVKVDELEAHRRAVEVRLKWAEERGVKA
ncbi:histidinol dehydrogenase-domain-containing protein [Kalaharituber pfeilii]|nr:histidinol dehydrogenase-domain-containing protein [Kalaharituber pfeilii]